MNLTSLLVGILLALSLVYFITMMLVRIRNNVATGLQFRESLGIELDRMRVARMLEALGIDKARYLHQQPVNDIHKHMKNCRSCHNISQCDSELSRGYAIPEEIDYCNNADTLRKIKVGEEQRRQQQSG